MKRRISLKYLSVFLLFWPNVGRAAVADDQIDKAFLPLESFTSTIEGSLKASPGIQLRLRFSQLGQKNACLIYTKALTESRGRHAAAWNEGFYRAVRSTVPGDLVARAAQVSIIENEKLVAPYLSSISNMMSEQRSVEAAVLAVIFEVGKALNDAANASSAALPSSSSEMDIDTIFREGSIIANCET